MIDVAEKCIVSTWLPRDVRDRLVTLASEADRSLSAEVRRALNKHIEARAADETPQPVAAR